MKILEGWSYSFPFTESKLLKSHGKAGKRLVFRNAPGICLLASSNAVSHSVPPGVPFTGLFNLKVGK